MLSFEQIAALKPLRCIEGRPILAVIDELNRAFAAAGVEFGENDFSTGLLRYTYGAEEPVFHEYRWVTATAVRGGNEGYYIHLTVVPYRHDKEASILISSAKTWDWASALEIAAVATRLLSDQ